MPEVPRSITSDSIADIFQGGKYLDRGEDSIVHRVGNIVVKRYPYLDLGHIQAYQRATNKAISLLNGGV